MKLWGRHAGVGRPLGDCEIIPRLRQIQAQIPGGSYAIDRVIELIEAVQTQPEPCEDAVSRHRLLNDLEELTTAWDKYPVMAEQIKGVEAAIGYVKTIPSVTPKQRWIPCSEKAHPDLPVRVQVQMNNGWIITAYYQDGDWLSVPNYGDVIRDEWIEAWRELPEPYRGEQE